jgi:SAM-dependent methyltransferase
MGYWNNVRCSPVEFLRIIHEKYFFLSQIQERYPTALKVPIAGSGDALEIGIGALGIGVISFLEPQGSWNLTSVDPMPRMDPILSSPLMAFYSQLMKTPLHYIQTNAEHLQFDSNKFDLIACYNVLDHTQNPYAILHESYRVLKVGGYFLLGLDALSLINWLRHKAFIEDVAHPYKFTTWHVEKLLPLHGFELIYFSRSSHELCMRFAGRARRIIAVGRKPLNSQTD